MPRRRNVSQSSSAPVLKVLLLGDGSVGKTSLRNQLIYNRFSPSYKATIGTDFVTKHLDAGGREVAMQIWDTAGQERFISLGVAYYRGADACVLVYDVTNPKSLESLPKWMSLFIEQSGIPDPKTFCFVMVGNKTDLREERTNLGHPHATSTHSTPETSIPYFETSAFLAHRTTDPFLHIAATVRIPKFEFNMLADDEWNTDQDEPINVMETSNSMGRGCAC
ncbi:P-loop containing nucleoside triphosphate hydrolase protein [Gaertneriomyces semiglobifer]|nr:P-loop containing nucleoside triphosphate hydrolase protein [Gaertneriomyces semiglobifer]